MSSKKQKLLQILNDYRGDIINFLVLNQNKIKVIQAIKPNGFNKLLAILRIIKENTKTFKTTITFVDTETIEKMLYLFMVNPNWLDSLRLTPTSRRNIRISKLLKTIDTRMISYFTDLEHFNKKKVLEKVGKLNVFRSYKFEYMSIKNISDLIDNLYDQSILLHETWMVVAKEKEEKKMQAMIDASEEQELKVRLDALRCS